MSGLLSRGGKGHGIVGGGEAPQSGAKEPGECWAKISDLLNRRPTVILHMNGWCQRTSSGWMQQMGAHIRQNHGVKVIHGRRAALMAISDDTLALAANREFGTHVSGPKGMLNYSKATTLGMYADLTQRNRLRTSEELARQIREYEAIERDFVDALAQSLASSGQLMQYDYESLLLPMRQAHMAAIFQFLLGSSRAETPAIMASKAFGSSESSEDEGAALEGATLHPPTCSSRVTDWPSLRAMIKGTNTLIACDRMEGYLNQTIQRTHTHQR